MRPPLRLSSLVVALLCALAWLFSPNARAASPLADFDAARAQALREAIARVLVEEQVAGVGVALVDREGARFVAGVGEADVARGRPVTADTLFRVGSITKSFVALAIVTQVERGALRLDDRVAALLPGVAIDNAWEDEAPITVAHLLEHTAGFDDMRFNETFGGPECELLPLDAVLARNPRSRQARWRPGTRFAYANPGYTVAARALEEVTGEPYEQTVTRELLAPLGMDGAALRQGPGVQGRLAVGYVAPGEAVEYQCILHRPAGSLMASPRDLAELVRFWINRGEVEGRPLISRASVERIERSGTLPALGLDTDYGLGNYGDVRGPARTRGHDGGLPGYLSSYGYSAELGVGYVMLLNATYSPAAYLRIRALLMAELTRGLPMPAPPRYQPAPGELAEHVGAYEFQSPRHALFGFLDRAVLAAEVSLDRDTLQLTLPAAGARVPLIPTGPGTFRMPGQAGSSVAFTRDAAGRRRATVMMGMAYEEAPGVLLTLRRLALAVALFLLETAVLLSLLWIPRRLFGKALPPGYARTRGAALAAALCFYAMIYVFVAGAQRFALGEVNRYSLGFLLLSLLFAGSSGAALARALRSLRRGRLDLITRVHSLVVAIAAFGITLWLMAHGIIGLRTWAW